MPAPGTYTYSTSALVAAQTSFRDLLDAGASNAYVEILDESDTVLATVDLSDPCGTVDGAGQLTFSIAGPDTSADATGTASWARFRDSDGNTCLSLPAQQGTTPVSGYIVLNTLSVVATGYFEIISATVG